MNDDMEIHPFTEHAIRMFRIGNDPSIGEARSNQIVDQLVDEIIELGDKDKGEVIIDLLTLLNAMEQVVSIMQVQGIEEASK